MSNFATELKTEISRIAKKETRQETASLKKASSQHRSDLASLKRRVAELEALVKKLSKESRKTTKAVEPEKADKLRFRTDGFATMRKKLGITAAEMGQLLGVTGQSVYKWEQGKAKPRASQLQAIAAVRKMGKREVVAKLGQA